MKLSTQPVLIVGAGPVGLTTACFLQLHQIPYLIIEKAVKPHNFSKAFAVHSRTLEVFNRIGMAERMIAAGKKITDANFFSGDKQFMNTPFADMDAYYPFLLALPQNRVERMLEERLIELGGKVERGVSLTEIISDDQEVVTRLQSADGETQNMNFSYVVAADGSRSTTRHLLKIPVKTKAYKNAFIVVDAKVSWDKLEEQANTYLSDKGYLMLTPYPEKDVYRVVLDCKATKTDGTPTLEEVNQIKDTYGFEDVKISDPIWISKTNVQRRLIKHYRHGRIFFAGDAAHVNSPVGGQGMNMGIQDADNLAWKLAFVIKEWASPSLLDSYHAERHPVARQVLKRTGIMNNVLTVRSPVVRKLRDTVYSLLSKRWNFRVKLAHIGAGLDYHYRNGPLTHHHPGTKKPSAKNVLSPGDRAPVLMLENGIALTSDEIPFQDPTKYLVLLFSGKKEVNMDDFEITLIQLAHKFKDQINPIKLLGNTEKFRESQETLPVMLDQNFWLHDKFGVSQTVIYVVRPDGFVLSHYNDKSLNELEIHLDQMLIKAKKTEKTAIPS